ncbi:Fasciclin-like arabinogalactan protein 21 [Linum perenne]
MSFYRPSKKWEISSPNSTVFAVKDSFFSPASAAALPPLLNQLLQYHTSPLLLLMSEILNSPPGTCLPTLIHGKSLLITKIDGKNGTTEINVVKISHPYIVLDGSIVIHGVLKPFSSTDDADGGGLVLICDAAATNSSLVTDSIDFKDPLHWSKIVRSLSSKGFVSFAIGLNSVLDGIRKDYTNLTSVEEG